MGTFNTGALKIFVGTSSWSAADYEAAYTDDGGTTGAELPLAATWKQLDSMGNITIRRNGATLDLMSAINGLVDIEITESDKWEIEFDDPDMTPAYFFNLLAIDPTEAADWSTTDTARGAKLDYTGQSLSAISFPVLIYRRGYDSDNTSDTPKLGTGSDPNAWCFFKMCIADRNAELSGDPGSQMTLPALFRSLAVDGTTEKGIALVNGALSLASS